VHLESVSVRAISIANSRVYSGSEVLRERIWWL
jgi:hypothetical protein